MTHTQVHNDSTEDKYDRIVHDSSGSNGGHQHDLPGSLPVDGIVEGIAELVEESSTFHLFQINGGQHESKKKKERLQNDDLLGVEHGSVSKRIEDESVNNHGKSATQSDSWTADGKEPVGEHEEDPEGEVDDGNGPLSKGGELIRHVLVHVVSKDTMAPACVLHDSTVGLGQITRSKVASHFAVEFGLFKVKVHGLDGGCAFGTEFSGEELFLIEGWDIGERGASNEGEVEGNDTRNGN
mmetsp:Transcript_7276/g.10752  ORF Transcript_7276/g.10752 Transcript_7276/m.10752 type:complete len:239 (-) Transcript_7276:239-955(-)